MNELFPKGMEEAIRSLIKILDQCPNSYSVRVFRYVGQENYRAEIGVNEIGSLFTVEGQ